MQYPKAVVASYQQVMNKKYKYICRKEENFGDVGVPNRQFFKALKIMGMIPILNFLRQLSLIPTERICMCGHPMLESEVTGLSDNFVWRCRKTTNGKRCIVNKSVRANSWFWKSKLSFGDILILLYELLNHAERKFLVDEYSFSTVVIDCWQEEISKVLIHYMETNSEKIGGPNKVIEVFEVLLGEKQKCGYPVEGQWFFIGFDKSSGQFFMVEIHNKSTDMFVTIIEQWIHPGSTINSKCWNAHNCLGSDLCNQLSINLSLTFIDPYKESDYTVENTWNYIRTTIPEYRWPKINCKEMLAEFIFKNSCMYGNIDTFLKFAEILSQIKWEEETVNSEKLEQ